MTKDVSERHQAPRNRKGQIWAIVIFVTIAGVAFWLGAVATAIATEAPMFLVIAALGISALGLSLPLLKLLDQAGTEEGPRLSGLEFVELAFAALSLMLGVASLAIALSG